MPMALGVAGAEADRELFRLKMAKIEDAMDMRLPKSPAYASLSH